VFRDPVLIECFSFTPSPSAECNVRFFFLTFHKPNQFLLPSYVEVRVSVRLKPRVLFFPFCERMGNFSLMIFRINFVFVFFYGEREEVLDKRCK